MLSDHQTKIRYHRIGDEFMIDMPWTDAGDGCLAEDIIELLQDEEVDAVLVMAHTYPYMRTEGSGSWSESVFLKDTRKEKGSG